MNPSTIINSPYEITESHISQYLPSGDARAVGIFRVPYCQKFLDNDDISQGPVIPPTLSYALNSSNTYGNRSIGDILKFQCDRVRYGRDLKVERCRKLFEDLKADDTQVVFADRNDAPHGLNLRLRTTSSKCR